MLIGAGALSMAAGQAQQSAAPAAAPAIDPAAMKALEGMGAYMRTLKAFQVHSTTSREDVLDDGQKVASDGTVDMLVERPNRLRAEINTDAQHRMFFFDGKTFT